MLSVIYPNWDFVFFLVFLLDFSANFYFVQTRTLMGLRNHYQQLDGDNFLIRFYYSQRKLRFLCLISQEVCFMIMYLHIKWLPFHAFFDVVAYVLAVPVVLKYLVFATQLPNSFKHLLRYEHDKKFLEAKQK